MTRTVFLLLLTLAPIWACSVPVFRYALERWPADFHNLGIPAAQAGLDLGEATANAWIEPLAGEDAVFSFPEQPEPWYRGPFDSAQLQQVVDSPLRRRIAGELIGGTTASFVWLGPDGPELERIRSALTRLQDEVELPQDDPLYDESDPASQLESTIPLQIAFALHHLDPEDAAETWFRRQLIGLDPSWTPDSGPLLVAVYGRGRAIPLYAEGLDDLVIEELAWFLCGACSCQVKALNPGTDLLFPIDWEEGIWNHPEPTPITLPDGSTAAITPVIGRPDWQPPVPAPAAPTRAEASADRPEDDTGWMFIALAAGAVAIAGLVALRRKA